MTIRCQGTYLWTAEEAATVTGAQAIDAALTDFYGQQLPWSASLVAQTQAHQAWWGSLGQASSAATAYQQWQVDRSTAQMSAQRQINTAHTLEALNIRTAEYNDTITSASASKTEATTVSVADYNYICHSVETSAGTTTTGLAAAAKTYADKVALAEQARDDAKAQAQRDYAVNQDYSAYQDAQEAADNDYENKLSGYKSTYNTSAGNALSTDMKAKASAHLTFAEQVVPVAHARRTTDDEAGYTFQAAASALYAWLTEQYAQLDANYWLAKTASLSTMAASFATTDGSPWAAFYAAQMSAYDDWSQATAPAQETRQIDISRAQAGVDENGDPTAGGEIGMEAAERDLLDAAADADEELASELADASYAQENAAADIASLQLSSGFLPATRNC